jgi:hypothetical protein
MKCDDAASAAEQ